MKKYLAILVCLFLTSHVTAQDFYPEGTYQKVLIRKLPTALNLTDTSKKDGFYRFETDNGIITQTGNKKFIVRPDKEGTATIMLKDRSGKEISRKIYYVRELDMHAYMIGFENNKIRDAHRFANSQLSMMSGDLLCSDISHTTSFEIMIVDSDDKVFRDKSDTNRWSEATEQKIRELKKGSTVLIYNIQFATEDAIFKSPNLVFEVE